MLCCCLSIGFIFIVAVSLNIDCIIIIIIYYFGTDGKCVNFILSFVSKPNPDRSFSVIKIIIIQYAEKSNVMNPLFIETNKKQKPTTKTNS